MADRPTNLSPRDLIAAYGADTGKLRAAIAGMSPADLVAKPIAGKWSTQQVVIHLADAEAAFADRVKRILAMDNPQLLAWDENQYIAKLHYHDQSVDDAVKAVEGIRGNLKRILDKATDADLQRAGIHNERGPQKVTDVLVYCVWHLNHHLEFVAEKRKALAKPLPAEITAAIAEFERGGEKLRESIKGLSREQLIAYPIPGTWSIQQIVIHLQDSDGIGIDRMKRIAAEEMPLLIGYNETKFANTLAYDDQSIEDAVTIFDLSRKQFARVLRKLPADAYNRVGIHNEIGKVPLGIQLKKYIEHFEHHLKFIAQKRKLIEKK